MAYIFSVTTRSERKRLFMVDDSGSLTKEIPLPPYAWEILTPLLDNPGKPLDLECYAQEDADTQRWVHNRISIVKARLHDMGLDADTVLRHVSRVSQLRNINLPRYSYVLGSDEVIAQMLKQMEKQKVIEKLGLIPQIYEFLFAGVAKQENNIIARAIRLLNERNITFPESLEEWPLSEIQHIPDALSHIDLEPGSDYNIIDDKALGKMTYRLDALVEAIQNTIQFSSRRVTSERVPVDFLRIKDVESELIPAFYQAFAAFISYVLEEELEMIPERLKDLASTLQIPQEEVERFVQEKFL